MAADLGDVMLMGLAFVHGLRLPKEGPPYLVADQPPKSAQVWHSSAA